ncbi:MAG: hypothetical protein KZQ65_12075, partial [Candidatus Thiodiazotropha sp. (ex Gloverina cf. vestifex)]|nr:hypothetical protein [Candidatus Thiodiazotropha sp. (ex Gloverina cf. vestifex)]
LTVTITAIQPRLRLSGTNRLGFQPSMAISVGKAEKMTSNSTREAGSHPINPQTIAACRVQNRSAAVY